MERKTIFFNAKVQPVRPVNQEFTLCKIYVCALGKNRNFSHISKETAEAALPTLYNCPVIGHIYEDENGEYHMGGHDIVLEQDKDGAFRFKSLCVPYGVIPQQDGVHFEEVEEPNGDIATYVVCDCLLWTGRFGQLKDVVYSDDCWFGQSMEINVEEHAPLEEDKNYTDILKYSYSALCLLGKSDNPEFHTEPCFISSRVEPYEFALNDAQFTNLMSQLKDELASCFANTGKGGDNMNENENVTKVEEPAVDEPKVEETFTAEEPEEITTIEIPAAEDVAPNENESFNGGAQEGVEPENPGVVEFASTYNEKREAVRNALPREREIDEDGVVRDVDFWLCDLDDGYAYVERCEYIRGNGCTEIKGRLSYTYNEENKSATVTGAFEEMFVKWLTKSELDAIESQRASYEELVEYKNSREQKDRENEIDAAIKEFAYMSDNEEFKNVYDNRYSYESIEALENACYIIKGKYSIIAPQQRKPASEPSVPVGNTPAPLSVRERFHAEFGRRK